MNAHYDALEFTAILERLQGHALSQAAKDSLAGLEPGLSETVCRRRMAETTSARRLLEGLGLPPLPAMQGLDEALCLAAAGGMPAPAQLAGVASFAESCKRMAAYLQRGETIDEAVAVYGRSIESLQQLRAEIERCVNGEGLYDDASPALKGMRRKIAHLEGQIREKLAHILQSRKQYLADSYITTRQGRYVLPVQKKYQTQFGGTVVEASGRGATVFIEPAAIARPQAELAALLVEEDGEVRRVLYGLAAAVAGQEAAIRRNMQAMEILDALFARAKLSAAMKAEPVELGGERRLDIRAGRHPLLPEEACVPLDFCMEPGTRGVVVTGPNTGGKTVALKTVGLLSLMAQCGLHIPCAPGGYIALQDGYWCDIGDSQDISQNLSTFSGHMTNVIDILAQASPDSLVLLDELGSGTDPAEGMGIAVAVLEELRRRGCMFLVTTHYPQVKAYTETAQGLQSARMAFDRESLRPLYRLEMGKSGESCALDIVRRLGLAPHLVERARRAVYGSREAGAEEAVCMPAPKSRLQRARPQKVTSNPAGRFAMGDSVALLPGGELGIVYRPADERGSLVVQVKGEKRIVRNDRLRLQVPAAELYPPDYDFSILFDSVENRKARHQMAKRHVPGLRITCEDGE